MSFDDILSFLLVSQDYMSSSQQQFLSSISSCATLDSYIDNDFENSLTRHLVSSKFKNSTMRFVFKSKYVVSESYKLIMFIFECRFAIFDSFFKRILSSSIDEI